MTARSEDRGEQVEARTLSGVHLGRVVIAGCEIGPLFAIEHHRGLVGLCVGVGAKRASGLNVVLGDTDLVTLTDGGEDE
jgi:hypothetical protein